LKSDARLFPPPWSVEELDACFVVKDSAGQKLAYVYFEDEPGRLGRQVAHGGRGEKEKEAFDFCCDAAWQNVHCGFTFKPRKFDQ
jgi:hypothetical protein